MGVNSIFAAGNSAGEIDSPGTISPANPTLSVRLKHQGGSAMQTVQLSQPLPEGICRLKIANNDYQFLQTIIAK